MASAEIVIGSDVVPHGRNLPLFKVGRIQELYKGLLDILERSDLSLINLECPLISEPSPIQKVGPVLGVPDEAVKGLRVIDVFNLANNHILDHGRPGLINTIKALEKEGKAYFGAGLNLKEAQKIYVKNVNGIRVGFTGMAEREFSIAGKEKAGANPLNIIEFVRNVEVYKANTDFLVVLIHGGNEHYPYPSPRLRNVCQFLVEQGANLVVCQHSHCTGCCEFYKNAYIVYGQGNFIFDKPNASEQWSKGFLIRLTVDSDFKGDIELIGYRQSGNTVGAQKMAPEEEEKFLAEITRRSKKIQQEGFLEKKWNEFCEKKIDSYFNLLFLPDCRAAKWLNRKIHLADKLVSMKKRRVLLNLFRCESHRDAIENILQDDV